MKKLLIASAFMIGACSVTHTEPSFYDRFQKNVIDNTATILGVITTIGGIKALLSLSKDVPLAPLTGKPEYFVKLVLAGCIMNIGTTLAKEAYVKTLDICGIQHSDSKTRNAFDTGSALSYLAYLCTLFT